MQIFIVDDGMELCRELRGWLEQAGHAVACSQPARSLPTALLGTPPGLLIIGMAKGGGQGFEFYRRLSNHRQLRQLPVIVVSEEPELEYELLDVYDFQARPFNRARLLAAVAKVASSEPEKLIGTLPGPQLEPFQELLHQHSGLHFSASNMRLLERGLQRRMQALQIASPEGYLDFLARRQGNQDEFNKLVGLLTVGETCFFRYRSHHDALVQDVLPALIARNSSSRRLRIWSAGCSTGEEPYSLAIKLLDNFPQLHDWDVQILATDINKRSLRQAREGLYRERALRQADAHYRTRYFRKTADHYLVEPQVRALVRFAHLNLQTDPFPDADNGTLSLDLILCRNVLIYFRPETIRQIVAHFADCLNPGGYLFLGHAETLQYISDRFTRQHQHGAFYYQLKAPSAASAPAVIASRPVPPRPPEVMPPSAPAMTSPLAPPKPPIPPPRPPEADVEVLYQKAVTAFDHEAFADAERLFDQVLAAQPRHALALVGKGLIHANQGHYDESRQWCARAISVDDLCAAAYLLRGLILDMEEHLERALVEYQKVLWLDREFVMAHYLLAKVHGRLGQTDRQQRVLRNAIRILEKVSEQEPLPFSGGLSRAVLLDICRRELAAINPSR